MSAEAVALLTVGALLELIGVVALAWPDFLPWKRRTAAWLLGVYARVEVRMRRLLRMPPPSLTMQVSGAASISLVSTGAAVITGPSADASVEEKIAFLLQRDQQAQRLENELARRLNDVSKTMTDRLDKLGSNLAEEHESKLAAALAEYRPLRILGTVLLAVGLACQVAANLI